MSKEFVKIKYIPTNVFKKIYNNELIQHMNDNKVSLLYKYLVTYDYEFVSYNNKSEILEYLLQNGADGNITNHTNNEAINYTIFNNNYEEYYKIFTQYGYKFNYNINCWRIYGFSLNHLEFYRENFDIDINRLLSITDDNNNTILHLILIYHLFKKNDKRNFGEYLRFIQLETRMIKVIKQYEIDINITNNKNQSVALLLFILLDKIILNRITTSKHYSDYFIRKINKIIQHTHIPSLLNYIEQNDIKLCDIIMKELITNNSHSNIKSAI